jgi:hypothetical protein
MLILAKSRKIASRLRNDETGAAWVWFALSLPVAAVLAAFVIDVANWFVHQRHLQTQVDAAALAGGGSYAYPNCSDSIIENDALKYSGDLTRLAIYNPQVANQNNVHVLFNSPSYWVNATSSSLENTDTGGPCGAGFLDVKATDDKPPLFFSGLFPGFAPSIHAHARVTVATQDVASGSIPIGLPDPAPKKARAFFVDESSGAVLKDALNNPLSVPLFYNTSAGGLDYWSSVDTSVSPSVYHTVTIPSMPSGNVGLRIALSGSTTNDQCGQTLVLCYDPGSGNPQPTPAATLYGIDNIRVYDPTVTPGTTAATALVVYGAKLTSASCTNPYFLSADCSVTLNAWLKLPSTINLSSTKLEIDARLDGATQNNQQYQMTRDVSGASCSSAPAPPAGASCWTATVPVANAGWHTLQIAWKDTDTADHLGATACSNGGGNVCDDTSTAGAIAQRVFEAGFAQTGQIQWVDLLDANGFQAEQGGSVAYHSYEVGNASGQVGVRIGITQAFSTGAVNDPPVTLRFGTGGQTQTVACNAQNGPYASPYTSFSDMLAHGCTPQYERWKGGPCPGAAPGTLYPGSTSQLWQNTPTPWQCAAAGTGATPNEVAQGLNQRILGSQTPSSCTNQNHWDPGGSPTWSPQSLLKSDPRLVTVLLAPYGTFAGSGNNTYPITRFAEFYITGWAGQGSSFTNPCQGNGDDLAGSGEIKGHFMNYVDTLNNGHTVPGCDTSGIDKCVVVLTQ